MINNDEIKRKLSALGRNQFIKYQCGRSIKKEEDEKKMYRMTLTYHCVYVCVCVCEMCDENAWICECNASFKLISLSHLRQQNGNQHAIIIPSLFVCFIIFFFEKKKEKTKIN